MTSGLRLDQLPTPVLLLDWAAAQRNIRRAAEFVAERTVRLRPHFKNHKCVPLAKAQLAAGGAVGMTAATVGEAEALVSGGISDVLIANQVVGPRNVDRFIDLATRAGVRACVDSVANAQPIAEAAAKRGIEAGVLIEVDSGMGRCGVAPGAPAVALAERLAEMPGLRLAGLQSYEGNAIAVVDRREREAVAIESISRAIETRRALEAAGHPCQVLSVGGTGTYHVVGQLEGVDELQIGSYVTMDWTYHEKVEGAFEIALTVLATAISTDADRVRLDVGCKGVGHEFGPPKILDHPELDIPRFLSEEHTMIHAPGHNVRVGDRLRVIPSHCCTTCNLHRQLVLHDEDRMLDVWPITAGGYALR